MSDEHPATRPASALGRLFALPVLRKVSRFAFIGALSGLIYLGVMQVAIVAFAAPAAIASVIGYVSALPLNFFGQRRFAFDSSDHWRSDLVRYLVLVGLSLVASYVIVWLVSSYFGLPAFVGGIATILFIPVLTYVCMDLWVFRIAGPKDGSRKAGM